EQAGRQLGGPAAGAQVAEIALGSKHGYGALAVTKNFLDAARLPDVRFQRAKALSVDVVDIFGTDAGFRECLADSAGQAGTRTTAVKARSKAGDFGIDARAAAAGKFPVFDRQHAGAFAQNDPVPVALERARSLLRCIVALRQGQE